MKSGERGLYKVIGCLTERHDLLLVATAAAVCILASVATFALLGRAEAARG
jgi:NO-binding membrane sensor protein with MHYT domain